MVRLNDCLNMTIVVDWDVKPQNKTKHNKKKCFFFFLFPSQYNQTPDIKAYLERLLDELREKHVVFDLEALLIKPVQRILKYPLLLNALIKVCAMFCFVLLLMFVCDNILIEPRQEKTCLREFPTMPDTNGPAQPQELARILKFWL